MVSIAHALGSVIEFIILSAGRSVMKEISADGQVP